MDEIPQIGLNEERNVLILPHVLEFFKSKKEFVIYNFKNPIVTCLWSCISKNSRYHKNPLFETRPRIVFSDRWEVEAVAKNITIKKDKSNRITTSLKDYDFIIYKNEWYHVDSVKKDMFEHSIQAPYSKIANDLLERVTSSDPIPDFLSGWEQFIMTKQIRYEDDVYLLFHFYLVFASAGFPSDYESYDLDEMQNIANHFVWRGDSLDKIEQQTGERPSLNVEEPNLSNERLEQHVGVGEIESVSPSSYIDLFSNDNNNENEERNSQSAVRDVSIAPIQCEGVRIEFLKPDDEYNQTLKFIQEVSPR